MIKIMPLIALFLFISNSSATEIVDAEWIIIPGVRVGKINVNSSEASLIEQYGKQNVTPADIYLGEGETAPGVILFPNEAEKKIEITWADADSKNKPHFIRIRGQHSKWHIESGISLGTSLKQIEQINGKPFSLAGFAWDGSGTIFDFDDGKLCKLEYCDSVSKQGGIVRRKIYISLDPNIANFNDKSLMKLYRQVEGDRRFSSKHPAMQQLNPTVKSITLTLNE